MFATFDVVNLKAPSTGEKAADELYRKVGFAYNADDLAAKNPGSFGGVPLDKRKHFRYSRNTFINEENMKKNRDTRAEGKIMATLLDNIGGEKMYLSQIAKSSRVSISTCQQILERKVKEGEIGKIKLGNLSIYFLDPEFSKVRSLKIARAIELLSPLTEKLKDVSQKIILFGSAAQGRDDVRSDFDIFILTNDEDEVNKIINKSGIGRRIQPVIKNFLELTELKEKNRTFYDEIMRGLVLWEEKDEE